MRKDNAYPPIPGTSLVESGVASLSDSDGALPRQLTSPPLPTRGSKSIFLFWMSGLSTLPPYLLRNIAALYQRYAPLGWTIYVLDTVPGSPLHVERFIDIEDPSVAPEALAKGTLSGSFAAQHTSDLVRYPLLLRYGGIYMDVGLLQFGDLNWLWEEHISNPSSPYDYAGFTMGEPPAISIVNFSMMSVPDNPLVLRAHKIFLKLWGGNTNTDGAHKHPLVSHVPLLSVGDEVAVTDDKRDGSVVTDEAMTDYAAQIQAMGSAQRWRDDLGGWDGPKYVREKCWLYSMIDHAYAAEQLTNWDSHRQFELFSSMLPEVGEEETEVQSLSRELVEATVLRGWSLKLAHGISAKIFGTTLGMLWRQHIGSDCIEGTYGGWLRWAQVHLKQAEPVAPLSIPEYEPTMIADFSKSLAG